MLMSLLVNGGINMAKSLYPYREAKISPAMWIVGSIIVIIVTIVPFIIMQIPSLA